MNDILGHDDFLANIATSLSTGRMHHAWLLSGLLALVAASMARLAAAWLLSEGGRESAALFSIEHSNIKIDEQDAGSNLVLKGTHPDCKVISPHAEENKSGQIKIAQTMRVVSL